MQLSISVWRVMKLMDFEQSALCIPKEHWQPLYSDSPKLDKKNVPVVSGSHSKCPGIESTGSLPFKRARTSLNPSTLFA